MRTRRNLPKVLAVYQAIAEYVRNHYEAPSMDDLVKLGYAGSTSVISYYFKEMVELKMALRTKSGSIYLLPLDKSDPRIRALLEEENE